MQFLRDEQDLFEFDDIVVVEFAQRFDFPELQTLLPVLVFLLHLFYGHDLVGFGVDCFEDSAECSVAQHLHDLVLFHCVNY